MPVRGHQFPMGEQVSSANSQEDQENGNLDRHDDVVEVCRLLDADDQNERASGNCQEAEQVEDAMGVGKSGRVDAQRLELGYNASGIFPMVVVVEEFVPMCSGDGRGQLDTEIAKQADEVATPSGGDGGGAEGILEHQIPADDPGKNFAESGIAVGVGRSGDRNHGRKFGIAKSGENAPDSGENKGEYDGGTGMQCRRGTGNDENASPDDGSDTERNQVGGPEGPPQTVLTGFMRLAENCCDRLGRQQSTHQSSSKCHCEFERAASRSRPFYFRPGTTRSVRHGCRFVGFQTNPSERVALLRETVTGWRTPEG